MKQLPLNTILQGGKYIIKKVLGQGGFGITYLAKRTIFGDDVAIKEFFFQDYCERSITDEATMTVGSASKNPLVENFKRKFVKEAQTIHSLEHPNIVKVYDVFEENGTAYYVMECIVGDSLANIVKHRGHLSEQEAIRYIKQVGDALNYLHSHHINHLDVKPANIMVRKSDDRAILIDFGTSKVHDIVTNDPTTTTPVGVSHGYAPIEQYRDGGVKSFSAQADIYSLGATLYKLVTGKTPPDSLSLASGKQLLFTTQSGKVKDVIRKSMSISLDSRYSDVNEMIRALSCSSTKTTKNNGFLILIVIFAVICIFYFLINREKTSYSADNSHDNDVLILSEEENNESSLPIDSNSINRQAFSTQRIQKQTSNYKYEEDGFRIIIDMPQGDYSSLNQNILEWINESMGGKYTESMYDGKAFTDYCNTNYMKNYEPNADFSQWESHEFEKVYENSEIITYKHSFLWNYGHFYSDYQGITFRKKDGRRFGWNMFSSVYGLGPIIVDGLKTQYFKISSDEEFFDEIQNETVETYSTIAGKKENFPVPSQDPWIENEGIVFQYRQFEISYGANGNPYCTIPLSRIKEYLNTTALSLLP